MPELIERLGEIHIDDERSGLLQKTSAEVLEKLHESCCCWVVLAKTRLFWWKNSIVFHPFAKIDEEASFVDFAKTRQKGDRSRLIHRENCCLLLRQEYHLRQFPILWIGVIDEQRIECLKNEAVVRDGNRFEQLVQHLLMTTWCFRFQSANRPMQIVDAENKRFRRKFS